VKEGQGGLRDLHTALWLAKVRYRVRTWRELCRSACLRTQDVDALAQALDFLWRVRNAMHLATGRHHDRLSFELQDQLAPAFGYGEGREAVERFMRDYYRQATVVSNLSDWLVAHCRRVAPSIAPGRRPCAPSGKACGCARASCRCEPAGFEDDPTMLVSVFARSAAARRVARAGHGDARARVLADAACRSGRPRRHAGRSARCSAQARACTRRSPRCIGSASCACSLPEFAHLECLVSHDPFHVYTVDHHSLVGVREIETLRSGALLDGLPLLTGVARELAGIDLLVLSMLCHDIGKGRGGEHSQRGALLMDEVSRRLGLNEDEAATCKFLVANHLHMSHLAQRRDIGDDALVTEFARGCGSVENLQKLFVLTYADMTAVAPGVWNEWRGGLVTELYMRAAGGARAWAGRRRGPDGARGPCAGAHGRGGGTGRSGRGPALRRRDAESYFLSTPEEAIARHVSLMRRYRARAASDGRLALVTDLTESADRGFSEFTICTADRPGLFAWCRVRWPPRASTWWARVSSPVGMRWRSTPFGTLASTMDPTCWERVEATLHGVLASSVDLERLGGAGRAPALSRASDGRSRR
jgi:[protein-PII] uridylyltransferase